MGRPVQVALRSLSQFVLPIPVLPCSACWQRAREGSLGCRSNRPLTKPPGFSRNASTGPNPAEVNPGCQRTLRTLASSGAACAAAQVSNLGGAQWETHAVLGSSYLSVGQEVLGEVAHVKLLDGWKQRTPAGPPTPLWYLASR